MRSDDKSHSSMGQSICSMMTNAARTLQWRHNGRDSVSNHQPYDCLLNRLFRRRRKKTSKLRVTGLCAGNSPETGEFPAQRASNADPVDDVIMSPNRRPAFSNHHTDRTTSIVRRQFHNITSQAYQITKNEQTAPVTWKCFHIMSSWSPVLCRF